MQDLLNTKKCTKCGQDAPLSEFYGKNHWCRGCKKVYAAQYRRENKDECRERSRRWNVANKDRINSRRQLKRKSVPGYAAAERVRDKYGMSRSQYERMLAAWDGLCAICRKFVDRPHIDHCHSTGKVRALLCRGCNHGIGNFRENPSIMAAAIAYIKKHNGAA